MAAFNGRHGSPKTKEDNLKTAPAESQDLEVGKVVTLDSRALVNKSYTFSDGEEDEEDEGSCAETGAGGGAAPEDGAPAAGNITGTFPPIRQIYPRGSTTPFRRSIMPYNARA